MVHAVTLSASTEFRHTMYIHVIFRQRASWNSLLFITNPRLAIGRVVSHDDVPFADWCCTMEVKAEFLLSDACQNIDSAFLLFDTTDFAAFSCAWMLVEGSVWSNVSSCFIINLTRGSVAVIEYLYSLSATRTGLKMPSPPSFDGKAMTSCRPASCSRNNLTRKDSVIHCSSGWNRWAIPGVERMRYNHLLFSPNTNAE